MEKYFDLELEEQQEFCIFENIKIFKNIVDGKTIL